MTEKAFFMGPLEVRFSFELAGIGLQVVRIELFVL